MPRTTLLKPALRLAAAGVMFTTGNAVLNAQGRVEECKLCSGAFEPNGGIWIANCNSPQQTVIVDEESPPRNLYRAPVDTTCFTQTPNGPIECNGNLCCDEGSSGWWMCNKVYDSETCQWDAVCARRCCAGGARVIESSVVGCPGNSNRTLACNPTT